MRLLYILLFILAVCTLWIGKTPPQEVFQGMYDRLWLGKTGWNPLLDERLPRLLVLISTGASLAVSGAVMQSLFQNPIAAPSNLGITAGGSLIVSILFMIGWHTKYPFTIPIGAVLGSFSTLLLVYSLSLLHGRATLTSLILTGIAISTVLISMQGAITYALRDQWQLMQTITEWEAGSTLDRSWRHVHMQLPLTLVGLYTCLHYSKEMNILTLGEEEALNLGVDVKTIRWRLFLAVSLLTGGALAAVGVIAFFGLVLPHMIRRLFGPDNRALIPYCILGGAATFSAMDICLRFFSVYSFSIGNISAILGGIFFLVLLFKSREAYA